MTLKDNNTEIFNIILSDSQFKMLGVVAFNSYVHMGEWKSINTLNFILSLYGPNNFLFVVFVIQPKIGSFRLPTHRRDAHLKFVDDPLISKLKSKF